MDSIENLRELALFAGAGGGILGGHLLGWRTVCAVEVEPYPACVLAQRQNDGCLEPFPVWDDVSTFDGKPWRGHVDVVSGGFPCQDISCAGKGAGIDGERSGLWSEMLRIIREVRPRYAFMENSPMLTSRGLHRVLGDLAESGYDAAWTVLGADDVGAPHRRKRIWILAECMDWHSDCEYARSEQALSRRKPTADASGNCATREISGSDCIGFKALNNELGNAKETLHEASAGQSCGANCNVSDTNSSWELQSEGIVQNERGRPRNIREEIPNSANEGDVRRNGELRADEEAGIPGNHIHGRTQEDDSGEWWSAEPGLGRVADGVAARVDRLKAIGNGQVPLVAATAFLRLKQILANN